MGSKQHKNHETFKLIKRIRIDILIKENKTLDKKKRSKLRNHSKRIRIKTIIINIYEI